MDRRTFLETAGAAPALRLMGESAAAPHDEGKFTPLDLARYFNASPAEFGPRQQASSISEDRLVHTLSGKQQLRGIPFLLGNSEARTRCWVMLSSPAKPWSSQAVEIPVGRKGSYVCLAQFCDWEDPVRDADRATAAGQVLANAVLVYEDGTRAALPVRRRLEVCAPTTDWGLRALLALAHPQMETVSLNAPLNRALEWGRLQTVVVEDGNAPLMWICALENPHPERTIRTLRMEAAAAEPLALCGATVYHGKENPLRYERLMVYRIALPEARAEEADRWQVSVDLGVVARQYALSSFDGGAWVTSDGAGLGGSPAPVTGGRYLFAEVTASPDATLALDDKTAGKVYLFDLAKAAPGQDVAARAGEARVRLIERDKVWVRARVTDAASGRAVPVRVAFRSAEGRYIPPYGHRTEINMGWFQDYGGDVKMGADSFAYVDGEFQVELPVGEVYVEANKGFEYAPVRKRLDIRPDQRELRIEMSKHADLRAQGWVCADTHVHFISPSTAILEGQAEGLNLINLLAAQWGDLYTNVGDLPHGPLVSRDREMVVWPGTENRHHLMGHIGLLGTKGEPVFPLSGGFPYGNDEAFPGDPLWTSMAEWADTCRAREGLAVAVHFPYPLAELAADIVLGKIDAIEIGSGRSQFDSLPYLEWYRYLNCGYRLPVAGGTDKMGANMAVGRSRTYAFIGQEEFSFSNWARAVRKGNTFVTTGPLLLMRVDGRVPGDEIAMGAGGGTVEVEARVRSFTPVHRVEIVVNGKVAAVKGEKQGARELVFRDKVPVRAPGWIAARCTSLPGKGARWPSVFAHTSALYLTAPGRELFSAPIAAYMLTLIDGTQKWVETIATRADPERYERIRKVLIDARAELERRMKKG